MNKICEEKWLKISPGHGWQSEDPDQKMSTLFLKSLCHGTYREADLEPYIVYLINKIKA